MSVSKEQLILNINLSYYKDNSIIKYLKILFINIVCIIW